MKTAPRVVAGALFSIAASFPSIAAEAPKLTTAEARRIIADGNREWGRARVALDRAAFEKTLAPDFYVQLPDRKITRQRRIGLDGSRRRP